MQITILLKKPTQFDVPLFRHIANHLQDNKFTVIYLHHPETVWKDDEINRVSNWGIQLTNWYHWLCFENIDNMQAHVADYFKKNRPDLLITNGYKGEFSIYLEILRTLKIPICLRIDSIKEGHSFINLWLRKLFMQKIYKQFSAFYSTGRLGLAYLSFIGIPQKKQFWFPYCTHNEFFAEGQVENIAQLRTKYALDSIKPIVLGISKFIPRENPVDLLEAFIHLNDSSLQLVMIGYGSQGELLVQRASLFPHLTIIFPGYVPYIQLPCWYALATVFVHPALNEPWGVSVQEALAGGCAVVASSRVGSAYDLIVPEQNGFIYPVKKCKKLAVCIRKALEIPAETVIKANTKILESWNYASVWSALQKSISQ